VNDQLGPELSTAARQLIADARGADDPSAEDEARVKARWLAGIAAGAGVSSLSEAVRAAASTGWGLKVGAMAAALAAAAAGVVLGWPQTNGQPSGQNVSTVPAPTAPIAAPAPVAPAPVVQPAPVVVPEAATAAEATPLPSEAPVQRAEAIAPQPAEERAVEAKEARPAAARTATARRPAPERGEKLLEKPAAAAAEEAAAPALGGQLGEEIEALSEIRKELQAGAPSRALQQLSEYRQRFGQPNLAMEADALRVDALCRAGQQEAARAAAAAFGNDWPNSPLQQRVSAACP
jgi:hypothetical protein